MPVLDRALQYQAGLKSPLSQIAARRKEAEDRQMRNELMRLNYKERRGAIEDQDLARATKQKDKQDRENLTPLYQEWNAAAEGQRGGIENEMYGVNPGMSQEFLGKEQDMTLNAQNAQNTSDLRGAQMANQKSQAQAAMSRRAKDIDAMGESKRKRAEEDSVKRSAKMTLIFPEGKEAWDREKFKDNTGKVIPFENAEQAMPAAKADVKIFDWYNGTKSKQQQTALQKNVPFVAQTLNMTPAEAMRWLEEKRGKPDKDVRAQVITRLMTGGYDGEELKTKTEEVMRMINPDKASAPSAEDPLGLAQ